MKNVIQLNFNDQVIHADKSAWFNATEMAALYDKRPIDWLRLPETGRYVDALCLRFEVRKSHFVKTVRGGDVAKQGTWMHQKLATRFAQWLDVDFAIWCDEQIEQILLSGQGWQQSRNDAAAGYRLMCDVVSDVLKAEGKTPKPYHFMNEARRVNRAITGKWGPLNRDGLPNASLKAIKALEVRNASLFIQGKSSAERDSELLALANTSLAPRLEGVRHD